MSVVCWVVRFCFFGVVSLGEEGGWGFVFGGFVFRIFELGGFERGRILCLFNLVFVCEFWFFRGLDYVF